MKEYEKFLNFQKKKVGFKNFFKTIGKNSVYIMVYKKDVFFDDPLYLFIKMQTEHS